MRHQQPAPDNEVPEESPSSGLTVHSLLTLPDDQRQLLNWMRRQALCTMPQIIEFLQQDEASAQVLIQQLLEQSFIQAVTQDDNELRYRVQMASMRRLRAGKYGDKVFETLMEEA